MPSLTSLEAGALVPTLVATLLKRFEMMKAFDYKE